MIIILLTLNYKFILTAFLAAVVERRHIPVLAGSDSASNFCRSTEVGGAGTLMRMRKPTLQRAPELSPFLHWVFTQMWRLWQTYSLLKGNASWSNGSSAYSDNRVGVDGNNFTCIIVTLGHVQLMVAGIACNPRLVQLMMPPCRSQSHWSGQTHPVPAADKGDMAAKAASKARRRDCWMFSMVHDLRIKAARAKLLQP